MTKELDAIIEKAIIRLDKLNSEQHTEYHDVRSKVVKLQKQLLSASAIEKNNLEQVIKGELQAEELKLFELHSNSQSLERNYLITYIKENYE